MRIKQPKGIKSVQKKYRDTPQYRKIFKDRCPNGIRGCPENIPFRLCKFERFKKHDSG